MPLTWNPSVTPVSRSATGRKVKAETTTSSGGTHRRSPSLHPSLTLRWLLGIRDSAVTGAQRVRSGYPVPFTVAAHVQLARYRRVLGRILREEAHPIGCYEVKPLQKRSIFNPGSGQRKRSTRLLKSCLRPTRGVVEGGRWTWVIGTGCVCLVG